MKSRTILAVSATALTLLAGFVAAQSKPATGFAQLKTLVGQWDGKTESGKPVRASYKLVSGGTALLESLTPADEAEMVTLYSADGDHVAAAHYCSTGNQPQMRTPPITGAVREFTFSFVSATNLPSPAAGRVDPRRQRPPHPEMDVARKRQRQDRSVSLHPEEVIALPPRPTASPTHPLEESSNDQSDPAIRGVQRFAQRAF